MFPAGRYEQGQEMFREGFKRKKEDLSGRGVNGSRVVVMMVVVEVSMVGHWQSKGAGKWHRKQHKEPSMGRLSCEEPCV